jgi:hypothetical protein
MFLELIIFEEGLKLTGDTDGAALMVLAFDITAPLLPREFLASTLTLYTSNGCRPVRSRDCSVVGLEVLEVNSEE